LGLQTKVVIRNERRHILHEAERMRKDKDISEEEYSVIAAGIQRLTDHYIGEIDDMIEKKIAELSHPL
jgi:ribosome recycling factor